MTAKFYAIKGASFSTQASHFGPFYPSGASPVPAQNQNAINAFTRRNGAGLRAGVMGGRYGKFPGVYSPPQPARGWFTAPAPGAITNHAEFSLDDGVNPVQPFEFIKSGSVTPGNVEVDITAAVTPADVAAAIVLAINTYTQGLGDILGGWFANAPASKPAGFVLLVQTGTASLPDAASVGWTARTYGLLGNNAIGVGVGSGLLAVHGFNGGTRGASGVFAQFVYPGKPWVVTEGGYVAVPKGD